MTEAMRLTQPLPDAIEQAIAYGDLSQLTTEQRLQYYRAKCESLGLNPLTQPFQYMTLQGKLVLYATKSCKEQLRKNHGISLKIVDQHPAGDHYLVTVEARTRDGRVDEDMGFAVIKNLNGDAYGNAVLKAVTKAKSRVTLSICGLGEVDETEIDSIPGAVVTPALEPGHEVHDDPPGVGTTEAPASRDAHPTENATAVPVTTGASPDAPPRQPRPRQDSAPAQTRKPIEQLNQQECLFRLQGELRRLQVAGQDPVSRQHRADLLMDAFGPAIDTMARAGQLGKSALQKGLQRLATMTPEQPPEISAQDGLDDSPREAPSEEGGLLGPEGQDAAQSDLDPFAGMPPDPPRVLRGVVIPDDVATLERWVDDLGHDAVYRALTATVPYTAEGNRALTLTDWENVMQTVLGLLDPPYRPPDRDARGLPSKGSIEGQDAETSA